MARALYGYIGESPRQLSDEVSRLRRRVRDLEAEIAALHAQREDDINRELRELGSVPQPVLA
jgi:hypothetical protein